MKNNDIIDSLKKNLDRKRFEHTLGVAYTSACLAMKYGYSVEDAYIAGLLHDCAKGMSDKERVNYCEKNKIEIKPVENKNPSLLHAKVGAHMAQYKYDINDIDIINAIKYHTTGRPKMSLLEEIVFVADYIEPQRCHDEELTELRMEAYVDLRQCITHIYANTLKYLSESSKAVDDMTQEAYDYYRKM